MEIWFNNLLDDPGQLPHLILSFSLKMVVIVGISLLLMRAIHLLSGRLKELMIRSNLVRRDNDKRLETLVAIVYSIACWIIGVLAVLLILNEAGINIAPFLVGASVFGAAIAFGTQSLVKDLIYGFFIVAENQFSIGDWIQAGGVTGEVQQMSFRRVILRDELGRTHILPNGEIIKVTHLSSAPDGLDTVPLELTFERLDYAEVVALLESVSHQLQAKPEITGLQTPLGVLSLKETGNPATIVVSVSAKVTKGKKWSFFQQLRDMLHRLLTERVPGAEVHQVLTGLTLLGEQAAVLPVPS